MSKLIKVDIIISILLVVAFLCKWRDFSLAKDNFFDHDTSMVPDKPNRDIKESAQYHVINLESGEGNDLTIDGTKLTIQENTIIKIKAGVYRSIFISNISGTMDKPIVITNGNEGFVTITEGMHTSNIKDVTISGKGVDSISHGIRFIDIFYRALNINGKLHGITLANLSFKNVGDYSISSAYGNGSELPFDGTPDTRNERFKILGCLFENAGSISFGGALNNDYNEDSGLFKDVEIAYNTFLNTETGAVCSFTNVQDYNIHHNLVTNINKTSHQHNGVFFMQGNGKFHHNKLIDYQGNAIRMWLYSRGSIPDTVKIHHNVCYGSRQYSAFELQGFSRNFARGKSTYVHAEVYNNTVGKMDTEHGWEGVVLDLYNYGGTLVYYNNLGFELHGDKIHPYMINNMSDVTIIRNEKNRYFPSQRDAVYDITDFVSKVPGIGAH